MSEVAFRANQSPQLHSWKEAKCLTDRGAEKAEQNPKRVPSASCVLSVFLCVLSYVFIFSLSVCPVRLCCGLNSVPQLPSALPHRMLPLLPLEQKGNAEHSQPPSPLHTTCTPPSLSSRFLLAQHHHSESAPLQKFGKSRNNSFAVAPHRQKKTGKKIWQKGKTWTKTTNEKSDEWQKWGKKNEQKYDKNRYKSDKITTKEKKYSKKSWSLGNKTTPQKIWYDLDNWYKPKNDQKMDKIH